MIGFIFGTILIFLLLSIYFLDGSTNTKKYNAKEARASVEKAHAVIIKSTTKNIIKSIYSSINKSVKQKKYTVSINIGEEFSNTNPTEQEIDTFIDIIEQILTKDGFTVKFISGESANPIICNISW